MPSRYGRGLTYIKWDLPIDAFRSAENDGVDARRIHGVHKRVGRPINVINPEVLDR
jgi:hypothetical protein